MEDVLGGRTDRERFEDFLANWESILARRVAEAVEACAEIDGVCGLMLAGSVGRGEPWPLSDIDLLPIYDDDHVEEARAEIERRRVEILGRWVNEGWYTGLDVGRLMFTRNELIRVLGPSGPDIATLLRDDRWYHSLDKGWRGRAAYDPMDLVDALAHWITEHRFSPPSVRFRLARAGREVEESYRHLQAYIGSQDPQEATKELRSAVKWLQTWQLERWGERDTSQGRVGTRFELLAHDRDQPELVEALRVLSDLENESVQRRMAAAPDWVWERHDRSWRARRYVGEAVTRLQDARDTLRVCSLYEMRRVLARPFPSWLAIRTEAEALNEQATHLAALMGLWFADMP